MTKNKSKEQVAPQPKNINSARLPLNGIVGFLLLIVGGSTLFADYLVVFGTEDMISKYLLVPNLAFWAGIAIYKAYK